MTKKNAGDVSLRRPWIYLFHGQIRVAWNERKWRLGKRLPGCNLKACDAIDDTWRIFKTTEGLFNALEPALIMKRTGESRFGSDGSMTEPPE